jgi:hypothetical protein
MATDPKKNEVHAAAHPPEGTPQWFFHEFGVVLLFVGCFLTMVSLPVILIAPDITSLSPSAASDSPYHLTTLIHQVFLSPFALGVWSVFLTGLALALYAYRFVGVYILLVVLGAFTIIFSIYPEAVTRFAIPWVPIVMVPFVVAGIIFFPQRPSGK